MTGTNDKVRSLFLTAIMVMSVIAMSVAFTGSAAAQTRSVGAANGAPTVVFVGEVVNLAGADTSNGNLPNSGSVQLIGDTGEASGETLDINDITAADFTGAATGGYYFQPDGENPQQVDVIVREPEISSMTIFRGGNAAGTTGDTSGADITDGTLPQGSSSEITVRARFNFDGTTITGTSSLINTGITGQPHLTDVDYPDQAFVGVIVYDENGIDVTSSITNAYGDNGIRLGDGSDPVVEAAAYGEAGYIPSDDATVTFTGWDTVEPGTYTIATYGAPTDVNNPDLWPEATSQTATVTITDPGLGLSLRSAEVTQGELVTGDVTGAPGDTAFVRVRDTNTNSDATVDNQGPFQDTGDVDSFTTTNIDGTDYHVAQIGLDNSGEKSFQIDTGSISSDSTSTIEISGSAGGAIDATADLTVNEPTVTITDMPNAVVIGDEFTINGEAPQSSRVKAWVKIGSDYEELDDGNNNDAIAQVQSDETFEIDVDSGAVMNLEGAYRIVVTADETNDVAGLASNTANVGDVTMSSSDLNDVTIKETQSIRANTGEISARLSSDTIATGDEITMEGEALGQGGTLNLFVVGPRGDVTQADGTPQAGMGGIAGVDPVSVSEQEYSVDLSAFDLRGTYQIILIGEGRNGGFGTAGGGNLGSVTQSGAVEVIEDAYTQPGEDNVIVTRTVQAQNAQLTIDDFRTNGQVSQGELELTGQSNRQDETLVFIEVIDENDDIVASSEGEVNGSSNSWNGSVDLSDVDTGTYTLRADDDAATDTLEFELVEGEVSTPTPTPDDDTPTPTPDDDTPTPTDEPDTATPTDEPTETTGDGQPGFGLVVALIALIGAALLAVRRNS